MIFIGTKLPTTYWKWLITVGHHKCPRYIEVIYYIILYFIDYIMLYHIILEIIEDYIIIIFCLTFGCKDSEC